MDHLAFLCQLQLTSEIIGHHKTVQYLTREQYFYDLYEKQMEKPYKRILIRAFIQSPIFALSSSFIFINFACAYRYGLWLIYKGNASPYIVFQ